MQKRELLTTDEAAEWLGVKPQTVAKWLRMGRLKGVKIGRLWRIPEESIYELWENVPDEWILELHICPQAGTLWVQPAIAPTVDPDQSLEMPKEWWESLVEILPDEEGWEDVKEHIRAALTARQWAEADEEEERLNFD